MRPAQETNSETPGIEDLADLALAIQGNSKLLAWFEGMERLPRNLRVDEIARVAGALESRKGDSKLVAMIGCLTKDELFESVRETLKVTVHVSPNKLPWIDMASLGILLSIGLIMAVAILSPGVDVGSGFNTTDVGTQPANHRISFGSRENKIEVRVAWSVSRVDGRLVGADWWIERSVLERQPEWDGLSSGPPLSPEGARLLALPAIQQRFPSIQEWSVSQTDFRHVSNARNYREPVPTNAWIYVINFRPKNLNTRAAWLFRKSGKHLSQQIVLMDGTVIPFREMKLRELPVNF